MMLEMVWSVSSGNGWKSSGDWPNSHESKRGGRKCGDVVVRDQHGGGRRRRSKILVTV